ncbi:hypothetical protein GGR50DRAFT_158091 [Xylaria sp. CBS 124048]|nr:hypothetical protein GGR50DRAFT_158091 [Xylaria sp. CBS 124048]
MGNSKYERLSLEDTTSSDLPLLAPDSMASEDPIPIKRRSTWHNASSTTLLLGYCALSTTLVVVLLGITLGQLQTNVSHREDYRGGHSFHAVFSGDLSYMSVDHKYDHLWEDLGAKGLIVKLPDENYDEKLRPGSISMFHQLHCLSSLRHAIQQAREGTDPGLDWQDNDHWPHCMDYLRKTLLCWADDLIERPFVFPNGTVSSFIDGAQDVRKCGDSRRLIQLMRDNGKDVYTQPFP